MRKNVMAMLLFFLLGSGADAQLLDVKPVATGGNPVGTWKADKDSLTVYAAPALVAAVVNLQFTGETTGTFTLDNNGDYQANYITVSSATGLVSLGLLGTIPFAVNVADTNQVQGAYKVIGSQLILTPSVSTVPPDTLSFSATHVTLQLVRRVPLGDFAQSLNLVAPNSEAPIAVIKMTKVVTGPLTADFDGDGAVDFSDFVAFAQQFGKKSVDAGFDIKFDLNNSGSIDFGDFVSFAQQFGLKI
jgi:hypothetical protein